MRISGNWATLLLPMGPDDAIDFVDLREEIEILIRAGVDGIYSNGTAGEFHNQTAYEDARIQELLASLCGAAGMPFVVGACSPNPAEACERVRRAARLKPTAIQVVLPDWWLLSNTEAADFLSMVADSAEGTPIVLYNPPHAKRVLAPADIEVVTRGVASVVGVKLGDGDDAWYEAARRHLARLSVFVPGHHLATGVRAGVAAGAFSNVACLSPVGAQRWTRQIGEDINSALEIERRLQAFMDEHIAPFRRDHGYSNPALDKLLAAIGGWGPVTTRLRRPYRWIAMEEALRLRPVARAILPEMF